MYAIFVNDSVIYLSETPHESRKIISKKYEDFNFNTLTDEILLKKEATDVCFYHLDIKMLWQEFKNQFEIIEAAGGVVFNEKNEVLWIYRNDVWDLPKGKIEEGETKEIAAVREVKEECGIKNVVLQSYVLTTYHIYKYNGKQILKVTYWYKMLGNSNDELLHQLEEGITKVIWANKAKMNEMSANTFGNIKLICRFAID